MRILISPAKNMFPDDGVMDFDGLPCCIKETQRLLEQLQELSLPELQELLKCNFQIAKRSYLQYQNMSLTQGLGPALFAYDGIQYKYMAPQVFTEENLAYVQRHLRILSAFYGVLRPMDGVKPYRLEMCTPLSVGNTKNMYAFWGDLLCRKIVMETDLVLNLTSSEYAKAVKPYLPKGVRWIDFTFGEVIKNRIVEKGVYVKMARGSMVRFLAEHNVRDLASLEAVKGFRDLKFYYDRRFSSDDKMVFIKGNEDYI